MQKLFLKFRAPHKEQDRTCCLARYYLELMYLKSTHSNKQMTHMGSRHRVAFSQKAENETQIFEFKLPYQPRQEKPTVPHSDVIRLDA